MSKRPSILITCEHGGNRVPRSLAALFQPHQQRLESHRGWDPGALALARAFAKHLRATLIASTISRLVVELNRSSHHRAVFSDITKQLSPQERTRLLERWYHPHRTSVIEAIEQMLRTRRQPVVHLGVHTFTPVLAGNTRNASIGLLYDPARTAERDLCVRWQRELRHLLPEHRVRRNYPYRGRDDGLTTALRRRFAADRYLGIELEVNQGLLSPNGRFPSPLADAILSAFERSF